MTELNLIPKFKFEYKIDMSFINNFKDKTIKQINNIKIYYGSKCLRVFDLFEIRGANPSKIIIKNCSTMMENVGKKLCDTHLTVHGNIGNSAALEMISGTLIIKGNVGLSCASGMRGGKLFIYGNTGDKFCSSPNTSREGLIDGNIYVRGSVGSNSIQRMRRGIIVIEKNIGDNCCSNLISGTIIVKGKIGDNFLESSKRGTVFGSDKKIIKGYRKANDADYNFIPFMGKLLESIYERKVLKGSSFLRYQGCLANSTNLTEIFLTRKN